MVDARVNAPAARTGLASVANHQQPFLGHVLDRPAHALAAQPGLLDAAILARMEAGWAHRPPEQRSQPWIDRQLDKINKALRAMSQGLAEKPYCSGAHLSLSDIAVGCALGYLDFRFPSIQWRNTYPNLDKLHEKLMQRQSFIDSLPK